MSDCFDHEADAWDSFMTYDGEPHGSNWEEYEIKPKRNVCKFCGTPNIEWSKIKDGWRLRDQDTQELHTCDPEEREWYQKNDTMDAYLNNEE